MKRAILAVVATLAVYAQAASPAATQAWVTNYVAQTVSELARKAVIDATEGTARLSVPVEGGGVVSNVLEDATIGGLYVTDAQPAAISAGVTNGMVFAWNGTNAYVNAGHTITATPTNLTYLAYSSFDEGLDTWLVDSQTNHFCRLLSTLVQPSVAAALIGGAQ